MTNLNVILFKIKTMKNVIFDRVDSVEKDFTSLKPDLYSVTAYFNDSHRYKMVKRKKKVKMRDIPSLPSPSGLPYHVAVACCQLESRKLFLTFPEATKHFRRTTREKLKSRVKLRRCCIVLVVEGKRRQTPRL